MSFCGNIPKPMPNHYIMRKYFLILALALMAASCATFKPQQRATFVAFLDYRPYTCEGFFISPNPYTGEYEPLGELYIEVMPEQKEIDYDQREKYDHPVYWGTQMYGFERINHAELLEMAVKKAVGLGANGIANFSIKKVTNSSINGSVASSTITYQIEGLCIKIKN